jgi:adenosylhomocysteine nucleosidase
MRVLVVAAMRSEMKAFRKRLGTQLGSDGGGVVTGVLGIGTALARSTTERLVGEADPDHVMVVGIAGGVGSTTAIGDLVVPEVVLDGASGAEHRPASIVGFPNRGTLHTSDELIVEPHRIAALVDRGVVALDMETAAVADVCVQRGIPWSVLRGISDHADAELIDPAILGLMGPEGEARPGAVARYLATHPHKVAHLARLSKGLDAATAASSDAAVQALSRLSA